MSASVVGIPGNQRMDVVFQKKSVDVFAISGRGIPVHHQQRFKHYRYYTGQIMGLAKNYNLCVDTGLNGPEATVNIIKEAVNSFEHSREKERTEKEKTA